MIALAGRQPWWWALLHGKPIENRRPESSAHLMMKSYRGVMYLHASAGIGTLDEFHEGCEFIRDRVPTPTWCELMELLEGRVQEDGQVRYRPGPKLPRGGIIGRARVVGLITPDGDPWGIEGKFAVEKYKPDMRWHIRGQWGHILTDVEPLPFVPCKGALGLFMLPRDVEAKIG